ncbi:MAG: HPP family protein [Candidatus Eisenbacteria sp.]|nr:HPP family protein [Candidatus Eisenbacteria bacterium]
MKASGTRLRETDPIRTHQQAPQQSLLFRLVAFLAHLQMDYLLRCTSHRRGVAMAFVFLEGAVALGIISTAAYLTRFPLLFPPLGPSAFILFRTPMSPRACPRTVILAHTLAVASGWLSVQLFSLIFPEAGLLDDPSLNWPRIAALSLSMGLSSASMIALGCSHPPAAASALIVSMGYMSNMLQIVGLLLAVVLLVAHAFVFNRLLGGLPYPLWRSDPKSLQRFGALAGVSDQRSTYWGELATRIFDRRSA